jgi:hypothetical protein
MELSQASVTVAMPQPLPAKLSDYFNISDKDVESEIRPTYSKILLLERAAHSNSSHEIREQKLIQARVPDYPILEGTSMRAIEFVAREANACRSDDQLDDSGRVGRNGSSPLPLRV